MDLRNSSTKSAKRISQLCVSPHVTDLQLSSLSQHSESGSELRYSASRFASPPALTLTGNLWSRCNQTLALQLCSLSCTLLQSQHISLQSIKYYILHIMNDRPSHSLSSYPTSLTIDLLFVCPQSLSLSRVSEISHWLHLHHYWVFTSQAPSPGQSRVDQWLPVAGALGQGHRYIALQRLDGVATGRVSLTAKHQADQSQRIIRPSVSWKL